MLICQVRTCAYQGSLFVYQLSICKFKDQINIVPGYYVISVNGMCRSNVIIYQNETKFEILKGKRNAGSTF